MQQARTKRLEAVQGRVAGVSLWWQPLPRPDGSTRKTKGRGTPSKRSSNKNKSPVRHRFWCGLQLVTPPPLRRLLSSRLLAGRLPIRWRPGAPNRPEARAPAATNAQRRCLAIERGSPRDCDVPLIIPQMGSKQWPRPRPGARDKASAMGRRMRPTRITRCGVRS